MGIPAVGEKGKEWKNDECAGAVIQPGMTGLYRSDTTISAGSVIMRAAAS